ncbi:MAG: response regulator, partial [Clostridia bacterium]|nr:response regulator [Clostridia bacterium]
MMIKIAICDDDQKQLDLMQDYLDQYKRDHSHIDLTITCFSSSLEMLSFVEGHGGFDIYLLDIYMPGFSGTEAARQLRRLGDKGEIIFLTSSRDKALEAFEVDALQYIIKPFSDQTLFLIMDKVLSRMKVERRHFITLKTTEGMMRLYTRNVVFTEPGRN